MAGEGIAQQQAFTLIELSIVLVIMGLIVGGILVGQDLIKAAEVRAQILQIEKYNQAVNTFRGKFGGLPGDLAVGTANQFGFTVGPSCTGQEGGRDGNGLIESWASGWGWPYFQTGETEMFWVDLSSAVAGQLIDSQFPNSGASLVGCTAPGVGWSTTPGTTYLGDYFPLGKIGHGTSIYLIPNNGYNWYGLAELSHTDGNATSYANPTIPVIQAFSIDKKIDDGLPTTGAVQAYYTTSGNIISAAPNAAADTTTTCYNTTSNAYSISSAANYGTGGNCALIFRFQ